ncbi:hypothetical protein Gotur_014243 [Gossypium turneri]
MGSSADNVDFGFVDEGSISSAGLRYCPSYKFQQVTAEVEPLQTAAHSHMETERGVMIMMRLQNPNKWGGWRMVY